MNETRAARAIVIKMEPDLTKALNLVTVAWLAMSSEHSMSEQEVGAMESILGDAVSKLRAAVEQWQELDQALPLTEQPANA